MLICCALYCYTRCWSYFLSFWECRLISLTMKIDRRDLLHFIIIAKHCCITATSAHHSGRCYTLIMTQMCSKQNKTRGRDRLLVCRHWFTVLTHQLPILRTVIAVCHTSFLQNLRRFEDLWPTFHFDSVQVWSYSGFAWFFSVPRIQRWDWLNANRLGTLDRRVIFTCGLHWGFCSDIFWFRTLGTLRSFGFFFWTHLRQQRCVSFLGSSTRSSILWILLLILTCTAYLTLILLISPDKITYGAI